MKAMYDCHKNPDEIASRMKISRRTVYNMIQTGFKYEEKEARERILDEDDRTATIIEAANEDRDLTAAEIARDEQLLMRKGSARAPWRGSLTIMG